MPTTYGDNLQSLFPRGHQLCAWELRYSKIKTEGLQNTDEIILVLRMNWPALQECPALKKWDNTIKEVKTTPILRWKRKDGRKGLYGDSFLPRRDNTKNGGQATVFQIWSSVQKLLPLHLKNLKNTSRQRKGTTCLVPFDSSFGVSRAAVAAYHGYCQIF